MLPRLQTDKMAFVRSHILRPKVVRSPRGDQRHIAKPEPRFHRDANCLKSPHRLKTPIEISSNVLLAISHSSITMSSK